MTGLFFTGTDTGVGKTTVAAAAARELRRQGHGVQVCKPVATGASWIDGRWLGDDTRILADAAGTPGELDAITPWVFAEPAAPPVTARGQGMTLHLADLAHSVVRRQRPGTALLVEGVGGLLCPLTDQETVADLALQLGLPLVIVTRRGLGTLNHTLLTVEAAQRRGLAIAGLVVNATTPERGLAEETNVGELRRRLSTPILAEVPYQVALRRDDIPALAQVDWWRLCRGE